MATSALKVSKSVFKRPVHMNDIARSILRRGNTNTIIVRGLPGSAKTALLALIAEMNGDKWRKPGDHYPEDKFVYVYVDCNDMQPGDLISKIPVIAEGRIKEMFNDIFCLSDPRPKVYMFDEVLKIPRTSKGMVTRIMYERTFGGFPMGPQDIVFGTSNTALDNIGDFMGKHEKTRITEVTMLPPDATTWLAWAAKKRINATMQAVVALNPSMLDTYITLDADALNANPYANHPHKPEQDGFVTLRGLEKAAHFLDDRPMVDDETTLAFVAGTIGDAATSLIQQFIHMEKDIIQPETILADPEGAPLPQNPICAMITLFKTPPAIKTQDDLCKMVTYIQRIPNEMLQSSWALLIMRDPKTDRMAHRNEYFNKWKLRFEKYLTA
jgi:hypothetical protein